MKISIKKGSNSEGCFSEKVLKSINHDLRNTIFSFIPNTAETAYGLIKGAEAYLNEIKVKRIQGWDKEFDEEKLREMIERRVRIEKIAIKDAGRCVPSLQKTPHGMKWYNMSMISPTEP